MAINNEQVNLANGTQQTAAVVIQRIQDNLNVLHNDPSGDVASVNGQTGDVNLNSGNLDYTGGMTIKQALDTLFGTVSSVTLSGGNTYEVGTVVNTVNLTWAYNVTIVSQSLDNGIGSLDPSLRSYTHSGQNITTDRVYTITGSDGTDTFTDTTKVAFQYKRYWGTSANTTLNNAEILALSSELSTKTTQSRTFNCSGGRYFYFVWPVAWGTATFKLNGFAYSDIIRTQQDLVTATGVTVPVYVYRCGNMQTGSAIPVDVS